MLNIRSRSCSYNQASHQRVPSIDKANRLRDFNKMDVVTAILDILFLAIAIAFFPSARNIATPPPGADHCRPSSPLLDHLHLHPPSPSTPSTSPLPSPAAVPLITITPDHDRLRPSHKRKAVSFSLASASELLPDTVFKSRRPPTPYVSGPVSPSQGKVEVWSAPGTPAFPNRAVMDPMGVQKGWLMP